MRRAPFDGFAEGCGECGAANGARSRASGTAGTNGGTGPGVATGAEWDSLGGVQPLKTIVTVLVLAGWAACTAHCAVEKLRGGGELPCCDEDGGQSDQLPHAPGHCVCSAIEAGGYVSADAAVAIPLPLDGVVLFVVAPEPADLAAEPGGVEPASSPLWATEPWQFSFRAALAARAPSLVS